MNPPTVPDYRPPPAPQRRVISTCVVQEPEGYGPYPSLPKLVALCDDGTLWIMRPTGDPYHGAQMAYAWVQLQGPPP